MTAIDTSTTTTSPDFADVYADNLDAVWRFVRSRVPDHHEAHDVTSDVFVRAWRSWDRFDRSRPVEPWLFTIAHRTVTDWWRKRRETPVDDEALSTPETSTPESEALRAELLAQLGVALENLRPNERDALALRFAARLSMEHVAEVLGTSTGAAKMMIHRSIKRLRAAELEDGEADGPSADLEAVIDDVLARGHGSISDSDLHGMLLALAELHQPPVPEDLSQHVAACVQCAAEEDVRDPDDGPDGPGGGRTGGSTGGNGRGWVANRLAAIVAFMGVCLICTVPALQTLSFALGVGMAGYVLHLVGVAGTPLVLWLIYRGIRSHGRDRGFRLARAGAIVMGVHAVTHIAFEVLADVHVAGWIELTGEVTFVVSDWVATALLIAGAVVNLVDTQRWRRAQAAGLRTAVAAARG